MIIHKKVRKYKLYNWQNFVLNHLSKYNIITAARQFGKTELVCELINTICLAPHLMSPVINLCSDKASRLYSIYRNKLDNYFKYFTGWKWSHPNQSTVKLVRNNGTVAQINLIGSIAKPTGCTGTSPHLTIIDEAALVSETFILKSAMPAADKTKGIIIITGTVSPGAFKRLRDFAKKQVAAGNSAWFVFEVFLNDKEYVYDIHDEHTIAAIESRYDLTNPKHRIIYETEYLGIWDSQSTEGKPYNSLLSVLSDKGHIGNFNFNRQLPLCTVWDDGRNTTGVWLFQVSNNMLAFIKYIEFKNTSLPYVARQVLKIFTELNAIWGVHILPHTMKERSYQLESQISRHAQLRQLFLGQGGYIVNDKPSSIQTKLNAGIETLPYCLFDIEGCKQGIDFLKDYTLKKQTVEGVLNTYQDKIDSLAPSSHCGDAFTEAAMAYKTGELESMLQFIITGPYLPVQGVNSLLTPY